MVVSVNWTRMDAQSSSALMALHVKMLKLLTQALFAPNAPLDTVKTLRNAMVIKSFLTS